MQAGEIVEFPPGCIYVTVEPSHHDCWRVFFLNPGVYCIIKTSIIETDIKRMNEQVEQW